MTLRVVDGADDEWWLDDELLVRQLELRAELIVARLTAASWERRAREIEEKLLPSSSPLRRSLATDGSGEA